MTNVTVTKEVAEAIEMPVKNGISTRTMLRHNVHGDLYGVYAPIQTMHVEELAKALIVGYTVEKSPEENVAELFSNAERIAHREPYGIGKLHGIVETLDILGIKISGVNA